MTHKLHALFVLIAALFLMSSLVIVACGDDDDDDDDDDADDDTEEMDDDADDDDDDDAAGCGPEDLCANAVTCGFFTSVDECTPWYENTANCADMAGYIDCNCDCLDANEVCQDWIDCGTECFNTLC
ncbi:MAG: hypothetical protein M5R36_19215 [Deltaproteobacteria bacterium]|nr:hypothetical protein [Deltaproteobacteria bacterium]